MDKPSDDIKRKSRPSSDECVLASTKVFFDVVVLFKLYIFMQINLYSYID